MSGCVALKVMDPCGISELQHVIKSIIRFSCLHKHQLNLFNNIQFIWAERQSDENVLMFLNILISKLCINVCLTVRSGFYYCRCLKLSFIKIFLERVNVSEEQ